MDLKRAFEDVVNYSGIYLLLRLPHRDILVKGIHSVASLDRSLAERLTEEPIGITGQYMHVLMVPGTIERPTPPIDVYLIATNNKGEPVIPLRALEKLRLNTVTELRANGEIIAYKLYCERSDLG